jgi:hypothetical protein
MSATDTAKDVIRLATTAGLSKDVIDLMEKKLVLLTDELRDVRMRISALEIENHQLRRQLDDSQPVGFHPFGGVLWKRSANGFEAYPYCAECDTHPVMIQQPPFGNKVLFWQCSHGHKAAFAGRPVA